MNNITKAANAAARRVSRGETLTFSESKGSEGICITLHPEGDVVVGSFGPDRGNVARAEGPCKIYRQCGGKFRREYEDENGDPILLDEELSLADLVGKTLLRNGFLPGNTGRLSFHRARA